MKELGSGIKYRIAVDVAKNRLYTWFKGDLVADRDGVGLLENTRKACALLKPGFTSLTDFTEVTLLGLPDLMKTAQGILATSGVSKSATVWGDQLFAKRVVDAQAQKVKEGSFSDKRRAFQSRAEAEAWLDERSLSDGLRRSSALNDG